MNKIILTLGVLLSTNTAFANPDVISREYKLMLQTSNFNYGNEFSQVDSLMLAAESAIEQAISRDVNGSLYLDHDRTVQFFDTSGSCTLKSLGYSFRERIENNDSEITLKFRSPDRYIADFEDLSADSGQAETKLESDVGRSSEQAVKIVYSHSTTAPNTRNLNNMEDINVSFPGFEDGYNLSDTLTLSSVSGLNIKEHVYKGWIIDLGSFDADIAVTLWYPTNATSTTAPWVAELSFKYKDNAADYSRKVVNRALASFLALEDLTTWVDTLSQTKTQFVYNHQSSFCN
jgi:hypothetical protein